MQRQPIGHSKEAVIVLAFRDVMEFQQLLLRNPAKVNVLNCDEVGMGGKPNVPITLEAASFLHGVELIIQLSNESLSQTIAIQNPA